MQLALNDAIRAYVPAGSSSDWTGQNEWGLRDEPGWENYSEEKKMQMLARSGTAGSQIKSLGGGQVFIPDNILASNEKFGLGGFDWGDMAGGLSLMLPAFGMVAGHAGLLGTAGGSGAGVAGAAEEAAALGGGLGSSAPIAPEVAAGGWDYNEFLQDIGIDPASTQFSGGTMSNADIMKEIGGAGLTPDVVTKAQELLKAGNTAKSIAESLGLSEGAVGMLGKLGATALGLIGSTQQANSLKELAAKYDEYGAPSRARYEASMKPGFDPMSIPGYSGAVDTSSKSILARLATGGNPFGNPGGLIEANKSIISGTALPAINEYQRLNANTGFGNSMNSAVNLQTQAIGSDRGAYDALGYGLGQVTAPKSQSLADIIRSLQAGGLP